MRKKHLIIWTTAIIAIFVCAGLYWTAAHHVIQTERGTIVLNKRFFTFRDTFVDFREWTAGDLDRHDDVKQAMLNQGYRDLVAEKRADEIRGTVEEIGSEIQRGLENVQGLIEDQVESWSESREREKKNPPEERR